MNNPRRYRIALIALIAALTVACDSGTEPEPRLHVSELTLEAVGDAAQLQVLVDGMPTSARWVSLDPEIVQVTEAGTATAVSDGTARVRATIASRSAEGLVTVLTPVNIQLSELATVTDPSGEEGTRMRIRNLGGRGYYRLEFWKLNPDGSHTRVVFYNDDAEAPVGLDIIHYNYLADEPADWVLAFSREPLSLAPVRTSCVRLDGHPDCPSDEPQQPALVDSVSVSPGAAVMAIGQVVQYQARAFANGVEVLGRLVEWNTVTPHIISLTPGGAAQALSPGYGQVQAIVDGVSASVGLTVMTPEPQPQAVAHLIIDTYGLPIRMWAGQIWGLQARVLNSQFQPIEGHTVTWSVQDPMVATVDSLGRLTALGAGTTVVTATAGGKSAFVTMKGYVRPVNGAELAFFGTLSDSSAAMVQRSVDTTWVDSQGVERPAFITFHAGHLSLDWSSASPSFEQRITMRTFTYEPGSLQLVDESEYVDTGSLRVLYDLFTGDHIYEMTSAATPGLTYLGRYSLPGEVVVMRPMGGIAPMKYYFKLQ
jgi:hypothetical protein